MLRAISRFSAAASIGLKATVGRSPGDMKIDRIEAGAGTKTACGFRVWGGGDDHGWPLQVRGGGLAIAAAILDRNPAAMREAAPQGDIHDLGTRALQQFAPGALEIDLAQYGARR